jgi:PAS domain S-box-containing protein
MKEIFKTNAVSVKENVILNSFEPQFRAIWENSFDNMLIINADRIILGVNDSFCSLSSKSRTELEGECFDSIFSPSFSSSEEYSPLFQLNTIPLEKLTLNAFLWNDKKLTLEFVSIKINIPDVTSAILLIIRDITEYTLVTENLKSERDELTVVLKNIGDGVITTDMNDQIVFMNKISEDFSGWSFDQLNGKTIIDFFEMLNANYNSYAGKINFSTIFGMYKEDQSTTSETIEIVAKNGDKKILHCTTAGINDITGNSRGFIYVLKDITEQVNIETQLNISLKMESIGQLAAGIAHEINTPMQYINDNTSFLKEAFASLIKYIELVDKTILEIKSYETELYYDLKKLYDIEYLLNEIPSAITQSRYGIEKVSGIISAMKDFSHPGQKEKSFSNINNGIEVTVKLSVSEWKYLADLELQLDDSIPPVYCIINELNQVILNMIVNAAHSIEAKNDIDNKGKITISTSAEKEYVVLRISDTGTGIEASIRERVFDPFFTTKEVGKGTGQGLTIAHNIIVKNHGGKIKLDSVVGEGSTFTIKLPIVEKC